MIKKILIFVVLTISIYPAYGQSRDPVKVKNLNMRVIGEKVIIGYDIINSSIDSVHDIRLSFITTDNRIVVPELLLGDIGTKVIGGNGKEIQWDITAEFETLNEGLKPYIILDGASSIDIPGGGPEKMFLSMLIPGLGDYFVADTKELRIKPYMKTISVAGLFLLGHTAGKNRWVEMQESTILRVEYRPGQGYVTYEETVQLAGDTHYKFFKHDAEIFYTLGAAVWIADVFWVLNKGYHNNLLNRSLKNTTLSIDPMPGGAALTLTF